jgi:acid stress-induced BolA-like protein IbaG/YrbA
MESKEIKELIEAGLDASVATVDGDGAHFTAIVISPLFAGKSRLQKQQLVHETIKPQLLDGTLHAISIQTYTPEEWQKQNGHA